MNKQATISAATQSAADTILTQLRAAGIDYFFANGGTDFPPVVEAYCRAEAEGRKVPRPIVVPHETPAVAMAHGAYLATGRMQAVMVHVNVGTANTINAVLDASRKQIPMLIMAGRSPFSEKGHHGTRTRYIHWAQEMFDQAGMVREAVKWDYELHLPDRAADAVYRAVEIAKRSPRGPVYLTLPRDILAARDTAATTPAPRPAMAAAPTDPTGIEQIADWLRAAEAPLIITANAGRDKTAYERLSLLADRHAIPVASYHQRFNSIASDHPFNAGHDPMPWVGQADVIVVLECDVPWVPAIAELGARPAAPRCTQIRQYHALCGGQALAGKHSGLRPEGTQGHLHMGGDRAHAPGLGRPADRKGRPAPRRCRRGRHGRR